MIRKIFILLISVGFVALFIYVNMSGEVEVSRDHVSIPENHLFMEGITLVRSLDTEGGYVTVKAINAYLNQNDNTLTLSDADVNMEDSKNQITSHSDHGLYVIEQSLETSGNISGKWNDIDYVVGDNGTFFYDFAAEQAVIGDNVTLHMGKSYINAKQMEYDVKRQEATFTGSVEMLMAGEDFK